jgi:hypothetical protein
MGRASEKPAPDRYHPVSASLMERPASLLHRRRSVRTDPRPAGGCDRSTARRKLLIVSSAAPFMRLSEQRCVALVPAQVSIESPRPPPSGGVGRAAPTIGQDELRCGRGWNELPVANAPATRSLRYAALHPVRGDALSCNALSENPLWSRSSAAAAGGVGHHRRIESRLLRPPLHQLGHRPSSLDLLRRGFSNRASIIPAVEALRFAGSAAVRTHTLCADSSAPSTRTRVRFLWSAPVNSSWGFSGLRTARRTRPDHRSDLSPRSPAGTNELPVPPGR